MLIFSRTDILILSFTSEPIGILNVILPINISPNLQVKIVTLKLLKLMLMFLLKLLSTMEYALNLNLYFVCMEMKLLDRSGQITKDFSKNWIKW